MQEFGIWSFVLFNDAWSQKGHSVSNTTVVLASSSLLHLLLLHIIITLCLISKAFNALVIRYTCKDGNET